MTKTSKWIIGIAALVVLPQFSILKQGDHRGGSVAIIFKTPHPTLWKLMPIDSGASACERAGNPGWACEGALAIFVLDKGITLYRWGR